MLRDHFAHEVAADDAGGGTGLLDQGGIIPVSRREKARHRPADADAPNQSAGVNAFQPEHVVLGQVGVQIAG